MFLLGFLLLQVIFLWNMTFHIALGHGNVKKEQQQQQKTLTRTRVYRHTETSIWKTRHTYVCRRAVIIMTVKWQWVCSELAKLFAYIYIHFVCHKQFEREKKRVRFFWFFFFFFFCFVVIQCYYCWCMLLLCCFSCCHLCRTLKNKHDIVRIR